MLYHTIDTSCDVIYLRMFTYAYKAPFLKKHVLWNKYYGQILKNKSIQTSIISFSESTFRIKVTLGRILFLILLTLTFKIDLICILLLLIFFSCISIPLLRFANCLKLNMLSILRCRNIFGRCLVLLFSRGVIRTLSNI